MTEDKSHAGITKGKRIGHYARRLIHIGMFLIPLVYYWYGVEIASFIGLRLNAVVWVLLLIVVVLEFVRLRFKIVVFGQREYERRQISAFTWGLVAILMVLLFAPSRGFGIAIIWGCAFGDPLLGELRARIKTSSYVAIIGIVFIFILWQVCSLWLGIAWWWALIMAPVTVWAEVFRIRWVDDNATMMLLPLLIVVAADLIMY